MTLKEIQDQLLRLSDDVTKTHPAQGGFPYKPSERLINAAFRLGQVKVAVAWMVDEGYEVVPPGCSNPAPAPAGADPAGT